MDKEIRKVKITIDGIKKDVLHKDFFWNFVILIIFVPPLTFGIIKLIIASELIYIIIGYMWLVLIILPLITLFFMLIHSRIYEIIAFKKGNITIKKDNLVEINVLHRTKSSEVDYDLLFSTRISKGKYTKNIRFVTSNTTKLYKWSANEMDGDLVGKIGDEYYLVFLGKSKNPSMIYNTRYFYIEGDEND